MFKFNLDLATTERASFVGKWKRSWNFAYSKLVSFNVNMMRFYMILNLTSFFIFLPVLASFCLSFPFYERLLADLVNCDCEEEIENNKRVGEEKQKRCFMLSNNPTAKPFSARFCNVLWK